jgi:hypothetical protein
MGTMFFFGQFYDVAKVVILQEDLANFGYKLNMKVKVFKHPSIYIFSTYKK